MICDLIDDVLVIISSFLDDESLYALCCTVRINAVTLRERKMRVLRSRATAMMTRRAHITRYCNIPGCSMRCITHVIWIRDSVYIPFLPYCLRHCVLLDLIRMPHFICVTDYKCVTFYGDTMSTLLGI